MFHVELAVATCYSARFGMLARVAMFAYGVRLASVGMYGSMVCFCVRVGVYSSPAFFVDRFVGSQSYHDDKVLTVGSSC